LRCCACRSSGFPSAWSNLPRARRAHRTQGFSSPVKRNSLRLSLRVPRDKLHMPASAKPRRWIQARSRTTRLVKFTAMDPAMAMGLASIRSSVLRMPRRLSLVTHRIVSSTGMGLGTWRKPWASNLQKPLAESRWEWFLRTARVSAGQAVALSP